MRFLLTEILYSKVTWWTKSLSIHSIIVDVAPNVYLMYYLDMILAICFWINHWPFALYIAYILIRRYLNDNLDNNDRVSNEDERIHREMHTTD